MKILMINEQKKAGDRNSVKKMKNTKFGGRKGKKKRARESQIKQPENTSDTSGNIHTQG